MAYKPKPETIGRVQDAINRIRSNRNESLTSAARQEHTTVKTIKKVNDELELFDSGNHKPGQKYDVNFYDNGVVTIFDRRDDKYEIEVNRKNASIIGQYWAAFEYDNFDRMREIAANNTIRDMSGAKYKLSTNIDYLLKLRQQHNFNVAHPFISYRGSP